MSKIKVPADSVPVPGESPLPGLQMATFLLNPHMAERDHLSHVSYQGMNAIHDLITS